MSFDPNPLLTFNITQADGSYLMYTKTSLPSFPGGVTPMDIDAGTTRVMCRATSKDGSVWTDPVRVDCRSGSSTPPPRYNLY